MPTHLGDGSHQVLKVITNSCYINSYSRIYRGVFLGKVKGKIRPIKVLGIVAF